MLFHANKLNNYQLDCAVTSKELISTENTLIEHNNMSCGANKFVRTNTHAKAEHVSIRTQRKRLILDDHACELTCANGDKLDIWCTA